MQVRLLKVVFSVAGVAAVAGCHKTPPPTVAAAPAAESRSTTAPGPNTGAANTAPPPARPPAPSDDARRAVMATLSAKIHFDFNIAELRPADRAILDAKVPILKANPALRIRITGNCDERGSDQYNIALGLRRAAAAREYLTLAGIDASRVDVASLGRELPIDKGSTETAWAANRRDEFEIVAGATNIVAPR